MLWAISSIIGLWASANTIRLARRLGSEGAMPAVFAAMLAVFHLLSLLLLRMFIRMLTEGGPRP